MQVDALVFQGAPQPRYEDIVEEPAFPIHRDPHPGTPKPIRPREGRELGSLICVHDLGRAELMNGLVQRFDAEVGLQGVRDPPGQNLSSVPVHDRHQIEEPSAHRQIGDVRTPDLVRAIHPQTSQQVGIGLVTLRRPARVGLLVNRHQPHEAH